MEADIMSSMFADACQRAMSYTRPVVISTRHVDGTVRNDCGTFIVLNREGWVITAGHIFDSFVKFQTDQKKIKEIEEINAGRVQEPGAPDSTIKMDPSLITNHSFWWGWDMVRLNRVYVNRQIDFAVGKLEPFDPDWVKDYPVLLDPMHARVGTSLCRLGYPFLEISGSFDEENNAFRIPKIEIRDTIFPNDGIHTRTLNRGKSKDGDYDMTYVETSTPGLKGQSGGPIIDSSGNLYGMQVITTHLPLGFHPMVEYDGRKVVENQFLNVGVGVHVKTIREILRSRGVDFTSEGDDTGFRIMDD